MKIEKVGTTSLIFVNGIVGDGTKENPAREVTKFYLPSGTFVGDIVNLTATDLNNSTHAVNEWQAAIDGEPFALKRLSQS